jgi:two-component system, sensor histidine kinase YesM
MLNDDAVGTVCTSEGKRSRNRRECDFSGDYCSNNKVSASPCRAHLTERALTWYDSDANDFRERVARMRYKLSLLQWLQDQRIRTKIVLVYIPLILIPLFVLGYASHAIYSNAIIEKTKRNVADSSSLIITRLSGMLTNVESCANMLTLNLNKILVEDADGPNEEFDLQRYTAITNQLSFGLLVFPDVESAAFVDEQGHVYGSTVRIESNAAMAAKSELIANVAKTNGLNVWFPVERRNYLVTDPTAAVLTLGKKIVNINTGQMLGILLLNVRESELSTVYRNMDSLPLGSYFIADHAGTVVSSSEPGEILKPIRDQGLSDWSRSVEHATDIRQIDGERQLVAGNAFPVTPALGWKLISVIPLRELTADLDQITLIIVMIGSLCCLFALAGAGLLSKLIASPIIRLAKGMKGFHEGNLDLRVEVHSTDEIGLFASSFHTMTQRIKELVANITLEQKKKREYELALIQSQIKPHFLYNTLDVIYALSEMGRSKDVSRTTKALADFYRVALSQGREQITVEEELRSVKDYLAIQHIRYSDVFTYTFEVDNDILSSEILKLTIQPIVENAIYHGLKEKGEMGRLTIRGFRSEQSIVLEVADDGVGMSEEKLQKLRKAGAGEVAVGFGLHNVDDRIKLYFGEDYGMAIQSEQGIGTTVTIRLPAKAWGQDGGTV